jgi:hypothetical protein
MMCEVAGFGESNELRCFVDGYELALTVLYVIYTVLLDQPREEFVVVSFALVIGTSKPPAFLREDSKQDSNDGSSCLPSVLTLPICYLSQHEYQIMVELFQD